MNLIYVYYLENLLKKEKKYSISNRDFKTLMYEYLISCNIQKMVFSSLLITACTQNITKSTSLTLYQFTEKYFITNIINTVNTSSYKSYTHLPASQYRCWTPWKKLGRKCSRTASVVFQCSTRPITEYSYSALNFAFCKAHELPCFLNDREGRLGLLKYAVLNQSEGTFFWLVLNDTDGKI